ncbi:unnamed protein product [Phytomonas sp. Hart1]|nr:unnamed protein product [Phytomonas sp. Hart1]|eukprot:CCW68686.1 unnamed protein product [Phytomonas sp. isolate Hart1]
MTYRPPINRLTDILKRNNPQVLERHAVDFHRALTALPPEANHGRFVRNHVLINPKALHVLCEEEVLGRYQAFAVYKPPFCPMRRRDAAGNFHNVAVESFIAAALKSQLVHPVLRRSLRQGEVRVRVLNDLDSFASGPVAVSVSDACPFNTSLERCVMNYDVLVRGHLSFPRGERQSITPSLLYPDFSPSAQATAVRGPTCTFEVRRNAYYSVHPVTLLEVKIIAPPSARAPCIEGFVKHQLGTFVIGDPTAFEDSAQSPVADGGKESISHEKKPSDAQPKRDFNPLFSNFFQPSVIPMRGDCDFPRVFMHLREIHFSVDELDVSGNTIGSRDINFHCWNCFEPIIRDLSHNMLKNTRINLLDGSWTPSLEFLN